MDDNGSCPDVLEPRDIGRCSHFNVKLIHWNWHTLKKQHMQIISDFVMKRIFRNVPVFHLDSLGIQGFRSSLGCLDIPFRQSSFSTYSVQSIIFRYFNFLDILSFLGNLFRQSRFSRFSIRGTRYLSNAAPLSLVLVLCDNHNCGTCTLSSL